MSQVRDDKEDGFTLIELLVVILIIGILAAIAIPVFLNQRQKANEASIRSDLRNMAISVENYFAENPDDLTVGFNDIPDFKASKGTTYAIRGNANTWCAVGSHPNSAFNAIGPVARITYDSVNGGIMPNGWSWNTLSPCTQAPGATTTTAWSWKNS